MTVLPPRSDAFEPRHNGPRAHDIDAMLNALGATSLDDLMDKALPEAIRWNGTLSTPAAATETEALAELRALADQNEVFRSYIGMGYHGTLTPNVILRNILENPGWYTAYTPYQAEIAQGRLELLLNFQTMVIDLTGLPCSNSSLLDEATAAAEAMTLCNRVLGRKAAGRERFIVDPTCHPQTIDVVQTRAKPLGIEVIVADVASHDFGATPAFGALVQYPNTHGEVTPLNEVAKRVHDAGALLVVAADLLSLALLTPPGEAGADVVVGNSQRFGVPMGFGGPHAGFMACRDEYKRQLPGRIIGLTKDAQGHQALRMAMQTREQHIRRDKATSNICTAQVLLAVIAAAYGVYHGPQGVTAIARRVRAFTAALAQAIAGAGGTVHNKTYFDTLTVTPKAGVDAIAAARGKRINLRPLDGGKVGVSIDETVSETDLRDLIEVFGGERDVDLTVLTSHVPALPTELARISPFMTHPVFNRYHSETEMLRYLHRLEARDLTLNTAMIPLGSCTMKLNATAEMIPVTWPGFGALHPFVPPEQARGYMEMCTRLEAWLSDITGFAACTLQPNSGAAGEYTGLLTIRAFHHEHGQDQRNVCLIPSSAHGTNPASATLCGMKVVVVACDDHGNIDIADLREKAAEHRENLAALMVTYPSTHGVFEPTIKAICAIVHEHGGLVYLDGANMNALVGLARPGDLGADVCHLNLHKTFCIPHGGGGPGVGPICMTAALAPFRPGHPVIKTGGERAVGAVAAAPWGSASILPISYAYIRMMGPDGLKRATQIAILNANYMAHRLKDHYPILYTGQNGLCAHECILDCRHLQKSANITVSDIAKRLMDYGFHAPTMSWPVAATLMVEPTESESKEELDRFCDAMIAIRDEIREVETGTADRENNILKHAPHTAQVVMADAWDRPYSRQAAAFPSVRADHALTAMPGATAEAFPGALTVPFKYWPTVSRVDDVYGDRHVVCACPPVEAYASR